MHVVPGTSPSHPLEEYAAAYEHPGYGVLRVERTPGNQLAFTLGELPFSATHRHFDTWTCRYEPFEQSFPVTFVTDAEGAVAEAVAGLEDQTPAIRFTRVVER